VTLTEPKPTDLVGVYVVDRFDLPPEVGTRYVDITLELHADGTFTATNVPPWVLDGPTENFFSTLISGSGKWEIATMGQLDPGAHPIWGVFLRDPANKMHPAECTGDQAPYGLMFELGNPDSGDAVLLKKKT